MLVIEALAGHHDRSGFACDNPEFADYLRTRARRDRDAGVAAPFVLVETTAGATILGYYTLSNFAVRLVDLPDDYRKRARLPRYPDVPATLIGRLARASAQKGLGRLLLLDALHRAATLSGQSASHAVVVDAIDEAAVAFYRHYGFMPIPGGSQMRMYMPMATAVKMTGG